MQRRGGRGRTHVHVCIYTHFICSVSRTSFLRLAEPVCISRQLAPGQVTVSGELEVFSRHMATFLLLVKATKGKESQMEFHARSGEGTGMHEVSCGKKGVRGEGRSLLVPNKVTYTDELPLYPDWMRAPLNPSVSALLNPSTPML